MTYIRVDKLIIIGLDNGLSPGRHQAIILTSTGMVLIDPLGTNFSGILLGIQTFYFRKMHLKMSYAKKCPLCLCLNVFKPCSFHLSKRVCVIHCCFFSNDCTMLTTRVMSWYIFTMDIFMYVGKMEMTSINAVNSKCYQSLHPTRLHRCNNL